MALRSVRRSTLAADAARELERMIVSGEWEEGQRIPPEPELMVSLGVSRNTVREAVRALTHLGLLEARPGDGTYVRATSLLACSLARRLEGCTLQETLETKECLERQAVRLAAGRRTPDDIEALRRGSRAFTEAFDRGEATEALTELSWEQEQRLVRISGNPLLIELFESIAGPVQEAMHALIGRARELEIDTEEPRKLHQQILAAIADGDAAEADRLIVEKARLVRSWFDESELR